MGLFRAAKAAAQHVRAAVLHLAAPISFREVLLFGGAGLIGVGVGMIYLPAGLIAAGIILAGVAVFGVK